MANREIFELEYRSNLPEMLRQIDEVQQRLQQASARLSAGGATPGLGGTPRLGTEAVGQVQIGAAGAALKLSQDKVKLALDNFAGDIATIGKTFKLSARGQQALNDLVNFQPQYDASGALTAGSQQYQDRRRRKLASELGPEVSAQMEAQLAQSYLRVDSALVAESRALARLVAVTDGVAAKMEREATQRSAAAERAVKASQREEAAKERNATAIQKEAEKRKAAEAREGAGLREQFVTGFRGSQGVPYAQQLGQAVKFSAFYGAAYRIQSAILQTFNEALQEGILFEQGLSDLSIATGQTKAELSQLANNLAQTASDAGASPSAGLALGTRAIGLYGASQAPLSQQSLVASISTEVVSKLALGGKVDPVTIQQNLAAITQALGVGAAGQLRIADLDAYFSKRFGTAPGDTLEAGAQSASVGIAAGFSIEEIQAAAALMISRTGQSSSAVGGYLAQIFSRGGEGSLTGVAGKYGIETNGRELADVFKDLAQIYAESGSAAQQEISAAFGRGKVQNAVVSLLQSLQEVQDEADKAKGGASSGALDKSFDERINNIGGEIAVLSGHFKEFARLFGQSGLLSILGLGIRVLDEFLTSINSILRAFNEIPGPVRAVIGGMLALAAAQKLGLGAVVANSAVGTAATAARATGGVAGVTAFSKATLAAVGPMVALTGGIVVLGSILDTISKQKAAFDAAEAVYSSPDAPGLGSSPDQFRSQADLLDATAVQNRNATSGLVNVLTFGQANDANIRTAKELEQEADRLRQVAVRIEERASAAGPQGFSFGGFSEDAVGQGLSQLANNGGSAVVQLNALQEAIFGIGEASKEAKDKIDPGELATELGKGLNAGTGQASLSKILGDVLAGRGAPERLQGTQYDDVTGRTSLVDADTGIVKRRVRSQLSGEELQKRLEEILASRGIENLGQIKEGDIDSIASELSRLDLDKFTADRVLSPQSAKALQEIVKQNIAKKLRDQIAALDDALDGVSTLTGAEALSTAKAFITTQQQRSALRPQVDFAGRLKDARQSIAALNRLKARVEPGQDTSQLQALIRQAQVDAVQVQLDQIETLRKAAEANAKDQASARRIGLGFVRQQINAIVQGGGNADQLAAVLATAGKGAVLIANKTIADAIKVASQAAKVQQALAQAAQILSASLPGPFGAALGLASYLQGQAEGPSLENLQGLLNPSDYAIPDPNGAGTVPEAAAGPTAAQIAAARRIAAATRGGGQIRLAQAQLGSAKADLDAAKKGTVEYYNALASYYSAQDALTQAIRDVRHIRGLLRIDQTDPVAVATLALQEARRRLREDRRKKKDPSVIAQDELDVRNAQTDKEQALFEQRLNDAQTAEQLGRISHAAYLNYLQSEHDRLEAIKNRTRQQQEQLNQIDLLMQEATKAMQGAWNIGDIKLPTPYEVRRLIEQQSGAPSAALGALASARTGSTTTIYIDGADTGKVQAIINEHVGESTRVFTTAPRRN